VSYDERIEHCLKERTIALTFDDGPSEYTSELLDLLASYDAKATFFIGGNNNGKGEIDTTKEWFDLIRRMVAEGHQVGSHTFDHVRLSKIPSELRNIEILKNERAIANIIGEWHPSSFLVLRCPMLTPFRQVSNLPPSALHRLHQKIWLCC
jgi:peptidoglycan/xylan/chitin deacetylase (PgdA/CDA1 family)